MPASPRSRSRFALAAFMQARSTGSPAGRPPPPSGASSAASASTWTESPAPGRGGRSAATAVMSSVRGRSRAVRPGGTWPRSSSCSPGTASRPQPSTGVLASAPSARCAASRAGPGSRLTVLPDEPHSRPCCARYRRARLRCPGRSRLPSGMDSVLVAPASTAVSTWRPRSGPRWPQPRPAGWSLPRRLPEAGGTWSWSNTPVASGRCTPTWRASPSGGAESSPLAHASAPSAQPDARRARISTSRCGSAAPRLIRSAPSPERPRSGRLRQVFRTESEVLMFGASGTGAMESAVANLCSPGEHVLVVSAGYFGERWASIANAYGAEVDHLRYAWGEIPAAEDVASRLRERPATAVFLTHSETSTGVVSDLAPFAAAARGAGALAVVDAISSLGAVPLETDEWGIDVVASGAQKALMTPPGLALLSASGAAWEARERAASPRFYFDWERTRKGQATLNAPVTPPVSLVAGLNVALGMLLEEGLETAFERHIRLGRACREGSKAMGLELFSPDDDSSAVVTAIRAPEGIDSDELVLLLR